MLSKLITKNLLKTQQKIENYYIFEHSCLFRFLLIVSLLWLFFFLQLPHFTSLTSNFFYVLCKVWVPKISNPLILLTLPFQTTNFQYYYCNIHTSLLLLRVRTTSKFIGSNGVNQIETWAEGMPRNPYTLFPVAVTDFCILGSITKVLCARESIAISWKNALILWWFPWK